MTIVRPGFRHSVILCLTWVIRANDDAARDADALFATAFEAPVPRVSLFWLIYAHLTLTLGTALLWVNQAGTFAVAADFAPNTGARRRARRWRRW